MKRPSSNKFTNKKDRRRRHQQDTWTNMLLLAVGFFLLSMLSSHTVVDAFSNPSTVLPPRATSRNHVHSSILLPSSSDHSPSRTIKTSTRLDMLPTTTAAAITGAITGGIFAGGLHAIAGPDHLAALLPRCIGQPWHSAGRTGLLWGLGHGVSATLLGVTAFGLKARLKHYHMQRWLSGASHLMELAVGLSLIFIAVMGFKEAREYEPEEEHSNTTDGSSSTLKSLSAAATPEHHTNVQQQQKRAVLLNGILHGFSWDGAPSLAPAVAVATWAGNLAFLSAYAAGTMAAMGVATTLIGEGTRRASQSLHRPNLPQTLSFISSGIALVIGIVWCGLAVLK